MLRNTNSFLRKLQRLKGTRTITGNGVPSINDGRDGDFVLRNTQNGVKLYAKHSGRWYGFVPEDKQSDEVDVVAATAVVGDSDNTEILADVAAIRTTVNSLLAKLRVAGIIKGRIKD